MPGNMTKTRSQQADTKSKSQGKDLQASCPQRGAPKLSKKERKLEVKARNAQKNGQLIASEILKVILPAACLISGRHAAPASWPVAAANAGIISAYDPAHLVNIDFMVSRKCNKRQTGSPAKGHADKLKQVL